MRFMDKLIKNDNFKIWMKQEILRNVLAGGMVVRCCSYDGEKYAFVFINGIPIVFADFVSFALNAAFEYDPIKSKPTGVIQKSITTIREALTIEPVENENPYRIVDKNDTIEYNLKLLWGTFDNLKEKLKIIDEKQISANWVNYHYYSGIMKTLDNLYKEYLNQERDKTDNGNNGTGVNAILNAIRKKSTTSKHEFHQQILIKLDQEYAKTFYQPYLIEGNPF
jgi:hypothetical protein